MFLAFKKGVTIFGYCFACCVAHVDNYFPTAKNKILFCFKYALTKIWLIKNVLGCIAKSMNVFIDIYLFENRSLETRVAYWLKVVTTCSIAYIMNTIKSRSFSFFFYFFISLISYTRVLSNSACNLVHCASIHEWHTAYWSSTSYWSSIKTVMLIIKTVMHINCNGYFISYKMAAFNLVSSCVVTMNINDY